MSKFDNIKIPDNLDEVTRKAINRGKTYKKRRKYKKAIAASAAIVCIGSVGLMNTSFADYIPVLNKIAEYFNNNINSQYESDKEDFEKIGTDLNLTIKDKGIELTIDSVSIDENYITVFHTVKSDKSIEEIIGEKEDAYTANPILDVYIDGKNITPPGLVEHEAKYISNNELKGMRKIDVSNVNIENNREIEIRTNEIFHVEGNWSVSLKVDKSKSTEETYVYNIDKDFTINKEYDNKGKKINAKHEINIDKVTISPLASKIIINEKPVKISNDWYSTIGNYFALFDEKGNSLDIVDKGGFAAGPSTKIFTSSVEFLKADKDTKSLTLVPISEYENIEENMLEPQSIDKLPIVFKVSDYGSIVIEEIEITDKEIKYTFSKDGVIPYYPSFEFYDEEGNEIQVSGRVTESLDRHTGRYIVRLKLDGKNNDISKIKKISTCSDRDIKLLYDQKIKINLEK